MTDEFLKIINRPELHYIGVILTNQTCSFCGVG